MNLRKAPRKKLVSHGHEEENLFQNEETKKGESH